MKSIVRNEKCAALVTIEYKLPKIKQATPRNEAVKKERKIVKKTHDNMQKALSFFFFYNF